MTAVVRFWIGWSVLQCVTPVQWALHGLLALEGRMLNVSRRLMGLAS